MQLLQREYRDYDEYRHECRWELVSSVGGIIMDNMSLFRQEEEQALAKEMYETYGLRLVHDELTPEEKEMDRRMRKASDMAKEHHRFLGHTIASYDPEKKKVVLIHPDGRREYAE